MSTLWARAASCVWGSGEVGRVCSVLRRAVQAAAGPYGALCEAENTVPRKEAAPQPSAEIGAPGLDFHPLLSPLEAERRPLVCRERRPVSLQGRTAPPWDHPSRGHTFPGQLASGTESWLLGLKAGRCASTPAGTLPAALSTNCSVNSSPCPALRPPPLTYSDQCRSRINMSDPKSHVSIRVRSITVSAQ